MAVVTVVGSGPSGVHFAEALLDLGHRVRMFDVGVQAPPPVLPETSMEALKSELPDPSSYFLGPDFEALIQPDHGSEYYGTPPSKSYVFQGADSQPTELEGFDPLFSWARGGLAEAWTGGSYPFNAAELASFPFEFDDLARFYDDVAERIGICGETDALARFIPAHDHMGPPLNLDRHATRLLDRYRRKKDRLEARLGLHMGRSRIAVNTLGREGRAACTYLGRCLWGCPRQALYTPSLTLAALQSRPNFEYLPGRLVRYFEFDESGRASALIWTDPAGGPEQRAPVEILALAAGTLPTARIYLESFRRARGEAVRLEGLMDNRQVMVPFLTVDQVGKAFQPDSYQYNLIAMGLEAEREEEYVHCLITTLKTALVHPVIQSLPLDLRTATWVFRNIRAALGLVNVNFHDRRRDDSYVELSDAPGEYGSLSVVYRPAADEPARVSDALKRLRRGLGALGAVVPPGMTRWRGMGASVHYAGTLHMSESGGEHTTDPLGRSRSVENLLLVDGSTFPFLPAKNLTFTLMANARRIAHGAFGAGAS